MLHIELPGGIPAPVAVTVLQKQLRDVLYLPKRREDEIPEQLTDLQDEPLITESAQLSSD